MHSDDLVSLQGQLQSELKRMIAHERSVLNNMAHPADQPNASDNRLKALYYRRRQVDNHTSATRLREAKARRYALAAAACCLAIPMMGLLLPDAHYYADRGGAQSSAIEAWLFGYTTDFAQFIGLLSLTLAFGVRSLALIFEPWLSKRIKYAAPEMAAQPTIRLTTRRQWRIHWWRTRALPFGTPWPRRCITVLPVTSADILASAIEHLQAIEQSRQA